MVSRDLVPITHQSGLLRPAQIDLWLVDYRAGATVNCGCGQLPGYGAVSFAHLKAADGRCFEVPNNFSDQTHPTLTLPHLIVEHAQQCLQLPPDQEGRTETAQNDRWLKAQAE
jgi:hypothetical protein